MTGGQNGLMSVPQPALGGGLVGEREPRRDRHAARRPVALSVPSPGTQRLGHGDDRRARLRDRRARRRLPAGERQDRSPLPSPPRSPVLPAALFAALFAFVAPDRFPFSQSILFLLAVIVGGAG